MLLKLTILSGNGAPPAISDGVVIDETGGKIGRGKAMNLPLVDPERVISNEHAVINFQDGQFLITDTSTNGTFINDAGVALGRGNSAPISNGDQFRIGGYVIAVEISAENPAEIPAEIPAAIPAGISGEIPGAPGIAAADAANPLLDTPKAVIPPDLDAGLPGGLIGTSPLQGSAPLSQMPSAGLGGAPPEPELIPRDPPLTSVANRPAGGGLIPDDRPYVPDSFSLDNPEPAGRSGEADSAQSDGAPLLSTAFQLPKMSRDALLPVEDEPIEVVQSSGIPTDWDAAEDLQGSGAAPIPDQMPVEAPAEAQIPTTEPPRDRIGDDPPPAMPQDAARPVPPQPDAVDRQPASPAPGPAAGPPPSGAGLPADEFLNRLLASAGLDAIDLSGASTDLIAQNLGVILRETVNGLVEVLRDRTNFKSEFRLDMTRIQATENNPLKFSTTTDDVVRQLLTNERAGLMEPGDAFREAFDDLRIHQLAMMVALKACLSALMAQLDPAAIEEHVRGRGGLKAKMFSSLGGEGWDRFVELYGKLAEDADEGFRHLLADEFGRAYEEQVDRLHRARFGEDN